MVAHALAVGLLCFVPQQRTLVGPKQADPLRLRDFQVQLAQEPAAHPIEKVYAIRGIALPRPPGSEGMGEEAIRRFADALLAANRDLFEEGLNGGKLVFDRARVWDTCATVDYHEECGGRVVFERGMRLVFGRTGLLTSIANRTCNDFDGLIEQQRTGLGLHRPEDLPWIEQAVRAGWTASGIADGGVRLANVTEGIAVQDGVARVALAAEAMIETDEKRWSGLVQVDSATGALLARIDGQVYAHPQDGKDGTAYVIDPNDYRAPIPVKVPVHDLVGDGYLASESLRLYSMYFMQRSARAAFDDPPSSGNPVLFILEGQATTYHQLERSKTYLDSIGFAQLARERLDVFDSDYWGGGTLPAAAYDAAKRWVVIDYLGSQTEGDTILHEERHAIHHMIGGTGPYGYPFDYAKYGTNDSNLALDEGLANHAGSSFFNDQTFSEDSSHPNGWDWKFNAENDLASSQLGYFAHRDGGLISGALWDIRLRLGTPVNELLATQLVYHVLTTDDSFTVLESCVLPADMDLFGGVHEDVIRRVFSIREVLGSKSSYPWSSPFLMSARPYADSVDETKSYTIPGAAQLKVTFDAYTRTFLNTVSGAHDDLHVMDGPGNEIAGSPFKGRELQNRTVTVPGDTVNIRLVSIPGDTCKSAGYRLLNVAAVNPANQLPLPVLSASVVDGVAPLVVNFDTSKSADPDGRIVARSIDPGDGAPTIHLDENDVNASHVYHRDGLLPLLATKTFQAVLTVADDSGDTATSVVPIRVDPEAPSPTAPTFDQAGKRRSDALVGGRWRHLWTNQSQDTWCEMGTAMAFEGDYDATGTQKLLVSQPLAVFPPYWWGKNLSTIDGSFQSGMALSAFTWGWIGTPLTSLGDIDGDGRPERVEGVPWDGVAGSPLGGGRVTIRSSNWTLHPNFGVVSEIGGTEWEQNLGWSVDSIDDLDGDGARDVVAGSPQIMEFDHKTGAVSLISSLKGTVLLKVRAKDYGTRLGYAVTALGDVNGDGVADFAAGAPYEDYPPARLSGAAMAYSGKSGAFLFGKKGEAAHDLLGIALTGPGDLDGDGRGDLVVGASGSDAGGDMSGTIYALSGANGAELWRRDGVEPRGLFGRAIARAGDIDRDGVPDLLVGAPGVAYGGRAYLVSGADGALLTTLLPPVSTASEFGWSLCAMDDVNLDGIPEIVVGDPSDNNHNGALHAFEFDPFLVADVPTISAAAGGTAHFNLDLPTSEGGRKYTLFASATGRGPSRLGKVDVPLTQDLLFQKIAAGASPLPITNQYGVLDSAGDATATLAAAPGALAPYAGTTLFFAAVSQTPSGGARTSSAMLRLVVTP